MSHILHGSTQASLRSLRVGWKVALVSVLLAAALLGRILTDDGPSSPAAPASSAVVMTHPEEGSAAIAPATTWTPGIGLKR